MERTVNGIKIDFLGYDKGNVYYYFAFGSHKAKLYYKHPKTWNDYNSNRFGLYFFVRFPNGSKKRLYLHDVFRT